MSSTRDSPTLPRIDDTEDHVFTTPTKRINDREDLDFFFSSTAYSDLRKWLLQLNRAMFPAQDTRSNTVHSAKECKMLTAASSRIAKIETLLDDVALLVDQAPPDTGPRRFGNVAFRRWFELVQNCSMELLGSCLAEVIRPAIGEQQGGYSPVIKELNAYFLGSFGSPQRLDYGTGHELSFLAFLGCLWKLGALADGEERVIVTTLIQRYLDLVRTLILTYTLEPAGSHGVWGLDDHSFIPYIFGSAQLGPAIDHDDYSSPVPTEGSAASAPSPSSVTDKTTVVGFKDRNMYFSAIQFIYDVKKGPFWEHSPVLYDISGIKDGWAKINKGMLKMYAAEVLGKFPVVQHFPFGSLFEWKEDIEAPTMAISVHARELPAAMRSQDAPRASMGGTVAPWAAGGGLMLPQVHASTGMPSTRAPQIRGGASASARPAPLARPDRNIADGSAKTAAPWKRPNQ